jgi:DNA-binding NtrC family response regulator
LYFSKKDHDTQPAGSRRTGTVGPTARKQTVTMTPAPTSILLVDDEVAILKSFACFFEECGYHVLTARDGHEGLAAFQLHRPALVFTDLRMPGMDGLELIRRLKELSPPTPIIVISGIGVVADAIEALKLGAYDYITKPVFSIAELENVAKRALETVELRHEVSALRDHILTGKLANADAFADIVTQDDGMRRIFHYVEAVAPSSQPVLISGQTGTGKELIARAVHTLSHRKEFIAVNVGGLDDLIFSDTLFGHMRGAYTGAERPRDGIIAQAAGGTLFLDEIGELTDTSQIKLLRLLQEQEYFPLGSDTPRKSTARIIAATNQDLRAMVDTGRFRQDLYYRLCTHTVLLPPLAARKGDIPLLLGHFLAEAAGAMNKSLPSAPPELHGHLAAYAFPGNVRELKSMVYDAVANHSRGVLGKEYFLRAMGPNHPTAPTGSDCNAALAALMESGDRLPTLKEAEEALISKALERANGNQGVAARYLGITRQGLNKILNRNRRLSPTWPCQHH